MSSILHLYRCTKRIFGNNVIGTTFSTTLSRGLHTATKSKRMILDLPWGDRVMPRRRWTPFKRNVSMRSEAEWVFSIWAIPRYFALKSFVRACVLQSTLTAYEIIPDVSIKVHKGTATTEQECFLLCWCSWYSLRGLLLCRCPIVPNVLPGTFNEINRWCCILYGILP